MPVDTRSTRKAKHNDGGKQKEKSYPSEEGSENASGSKRSIIETLSKKNCSSSPSSARESGRLRNGNYQPPTPSPLRRSERARSTCNSGKSDTCMSLADATHKSFERKRSVNELLIEAKDADQHVKMKANASSQGNKTPPSRRYRDLFRAHTTTIKASGSANWGRKGPSSSSNSGVCSKKVPVADEVGKGFPESTSKSDEEVLDNFLQEAASGTAIQKNLELHSRQSPLNASIEESGTCSKRQRMDVHLPETNLFQGRCASSIQEVCSEGKTGALMGSCHNGAVNIGDKDLQLDVEMECEENKCIICKLTGRLVICGGKCCRRQCHPACLDSQGEDLYPGVWHCPWCTQKKIKFGVHSVSEGIESILDVRVQNIQNHEGDKTQKEYFAKYKGLAHAHNCWLPEQQILLEAPELVSEFFRRENARESKAELENDFKLESAVILSIYSNEAVRNARLKMLEANRRRKLEELESQFHSHLNSTKVKHRDEREAEEKERILLMNEWKSWEENASNLLTNAAEVVPCLLSGNGLDEENSKEHGSVGVNVPLLHAPEEPHTDAAEDSSRAEVAAINAVKKMDTNSDGSDIFKSKSAIGINNDSRLFGNIGERALDSFGVQGLQFASSGAVEEVEKIATCKHSPLSAENPTVQEVAEANEGSTAVRMEQHDEASSSNLLVSLNSPSTMNPSVAVPVSQIWNNFWPRSLDFSSLHGCTIGKMSCDIGPSDSTNHLSPQGTLFSATSKMSCDIGPSDFTNHLSPQEVDSEADPPTATFDQEVESVENQVAKKTKTSLSKEEISKYFHLPVKAACQELNISAASLKKRCRELEIERWPCKKLQSIQTLINYVEGMGEEGNGHLKEVIEALAIEKRLIEEEPNLPLEDRTKKLRQVYYKVIHAKKKQAS